MNEMLIPAYKVGWQPYKKTKEEYIENTTVADNVEDVKSTLNHYVKNHAETYDVICFIERILRDEEMLSKTHIVWDGSYRNTVCLLRPDEFDIYIKENKVDLTGLTQDGMYRYSKYNSEIFFINLDTQPSYIIRKWEWEIGNELTDDFVYMKSINRRKEN